MNAKVIEPSAVSRRKTLGMVKAWTNASVTHPAPKICAITKSRAAPSILDSNVKNEIVPACLRMRPDSSGVFFNGMNVNNNCSAD